MRSPTVPLLLAVALVAAACSDSPTVSVAPNDPPPPAATVTPEAVPTATAVPAPSATSEPAAPTSTPPPAVRCPVEVVDSGADSVTSTPGDADGDGTPDSMIAYHLGDDPGIGWRVRIESGVDGSGVDAPVDFGFPDVIGVQAVGATDIDGDDDDEMVATVGSGASATVYGVFVADFEECTLEPITLEGRPLEAVAGSSVASIAGIRCDDSDGNGANDQVVLYDGSLVEFVETEGGEQAIYEIFERAHTLDGLQLVPGPPTDVYEVDLFDLEGPIGRFDCPPLLL